MLFIQDDGEKVLGTFAGTMYNVNVILTSAGGKRGTK
jgi:hypothetical protein